MEKSHTLLRKLDHDVHTFAILVFPDQVEDVLMELMDRSPSKTVQGGIEQAVIQGGGHTRSSGARGNGSYTINGGYTRVNGGHIRAGVGDARVGCLLVPRFPLACEVADRPELWGQPVVVAHPDAPVVWSASPAAVAKGVRHGQKLPEAVGRCPTLVVLDARPTAYERTAEAILDALQAVTPVVEPDEPGLAYVDVGGSQRGRESSQALWSGLLACAPAALRPRLGVAPTKFAALTAAHATQPGGVSFVRRLAEIPDLLAPQPVDVLPVSDEMVRRLRLVGVSTLGQLAAFPRQALADRFGPDGARAWDLVSGADEPLQPRPQEEPVVERLELPEPLVSRDALLVAARQTLNRVLRQPAVRRRAVRQVVLRVETERAGRWERVVTLREARGERDGIWAALRPVLATARVPVPVSELAIELRGLRGQQGWQGELFPARSPRWQRVEESLRQLKSRYGQCPVSRVVTVEPWNRLPEQRVALVDFAV
jgi:nucleotidyltransferase/DNA polymerase involved in DNA repair